MKLRMHQHWQKRSSGFTLIELLVVVAIIATLMAILLPALNKSREQARNVTCASNLRSIGMGFYAYSVEWDGYSPACDFVRNTTSASVNYGYHWLNVAAPYMGIAKADAKWVDVAKITTCPSSSRNPGKVRRDYSLNMQMLKQYGANMGMGAVKLTRFENPGNAVCLFDAGTPWTSSEPYASYKKDTEISVAPGGYGPSSSKYFAEIHNGKANVVYYDWHVEAGSYLSIANRGWVATWW